MIAELGSLSSTRDAVRDSDRVQEARDVALHRTGAARRQSQARGEINQFRPAKSHGFQSNNPLLRSRVLRQHPLSYTLPHSAFVANA